MCANMNSASFCRVASRVGSERTALWMPSIHSLRRVRNCPQPSRASLAHGFAIREARLDGFDHVAEFFGEHAEEEDDTLLVHRFVAEAAEVSGVAVGERREWRVTPRGSG